MVGKHPMATLHFQDYFGAMNYKQILKAGGEPCH